MQLGNRRFVVLAALGALLACVLSGCNSADVTLGSTNGQAVAIGQQALGFTSSGGSSSGWTSPISCPDGFAQGLQSGLPSTDTLLKLDPSTVSGPVGDPQLTTGYVATCAYRLTTATTTIVELAFFDIDVDHESAISTRLVSDGFASQGAAQNTDAQGHPNTQTIYQKALTRVVLEAITINSIPALVVVG
ncbi:MAG TPA: hypothetical protein VHZ98_14985 [Galbitalea sp.]|nr:hypothetical protein [Galbitalea sp.]